MSVTAIFVGKVILKITLCTCKILFIKYVIEDLLD